MISLAPVCGIPSGELGIPKTPGIWVWGLVSSGVLKKRGYVNHCDTGNSFPSPPYFKGKSPGNKVASHISYVSSFCVNVLVIFGDKYFFSKDK